MKNVLAMDSVVYARKTEPNDTPMSAENSQNSIWAVEARMEWRRIPKMKANTSGEKITSQIRPDCARVMYRPVVAVMYAITPVTAVPAAMRPNTFCMYAR